jgi:hypothetical protein
MQTSFGPHKQMSPIKHPFELWQICATKYVRCTWNTISHMPITRSTKFEEVGFSYRNTISHMSITRSTTFEEVGFSYRFQMGRRRWRWACARNDVFWNFHVCVKTLHEVKLFDKKYLNDLCWINGECLA